MTQHRTGPGYPFGQPGDIFFCRGTNRLARLIRWAERSVGEKESWANHVGGVVSPGYLIPPTKRITALASVSEALWHTEHHVWWEAHQNEQGYAIAVFRPRQFSGNEGVNRVVQNWLSRTGNSYGWWRLLTFLGEKLTAGKIPFTKLHFQDSYVVCSNHIAEGLEKDFIRFNGQNPHQMDPDEMYDYCISHPEEFKFIGWGIVPGPEPE